MVVALVRALLLPFFAQTVPSQAPVPNDSPRVVVAALSQLEFAEAPFPVPADLRDSIRFGWLTVSQDHRDSSSSTLRLAVSIISARTAQPELDPIVLIPGGPGSPLVAVASVDVARSTRLAPFRQRRAIVLLDPRGHGLSEPAMCPELNAAQPLEDDDTLAEAVLAGKLTTCRAELVARGVRLETLNAVQTAWDIDALRRALGAPQVNLVGSSYGSRLAAEAMRIVPGVVRAVHMDGPVPPALPHLAPDDARAAGVMTRIFHRCAEQPACLAAFPRLEEEYDSLLARVTRAPLTVEMPRTDRVPDGALLVDSALLREGLAQLGLNRELAAAAPVLIHTLATEGLGVLARMAPQLLAMTLEEGTFGTHLAFLCNDSPLTLASTTWLPRRCPLWVGERYGDTLALPLRSGIPTLVITGELDPRTPPSYAERVGQGLSRAQVIVAPSTGHERLPDCAFRLASEFFETPERRLDAACMDSVPPIRFVTDVVPSRWIGRLVTRTATQPLPIVVTAGAAAMMLLGALIAMPLQGRRPERTGALAPNFHRPGVLAWVTAIMALLALGSVIAAVFVAADRNPLIPALGVLPGWRWVLVLPWLCLALWLAALASSARAAGTRRSSAWWSGMAGAALVLGIWIFNTFA